MIIRLILSYTIKLKSNRYNMDKIMILLLIIACLNLITYVSVKDWKSTMIILLAGLVTYNTKQEIVLFLGILTAALFRSVVFEGLENPTPEPKKKSKPNTVTPFISELEGLTQKSKDLSDQQSSLIEMTRQLGPMMKQAESMMSKLPEGFLDAALEKFKTKS